MPIVKVVAFWKGYWWFAYQLLLLRWGSSERVAGCC